MVDIGHFRRGLAARKIIEVFAHSYRAGSRRLAYVRERLNPPEAVSRSALRLRLRPSAKTASGGGVAHGCSAALRDSCSRRMSAH